MRQEKDIVKTTRFLPLSIKMITVREVKLEDIPCDMKQIRKVSEAAVRQFEKDNFGREEGILERTFEYNEEKSDTGGGYAGNFGEYRCRKGNKDKKGKKDRAGWLILRELILINTKV